MGSRRKGRILAMQALFAWDMNSVAEEEICEFRWLDETQDNKYDDETRAFARLLLKGVLEKKTSVDDTIRRYLEHWDFSRLAKVDLALLRLGVYSLVYQSNIPATVTIDEAIEIAKEYSGDDSYRFINGVLDGVRRNQSQNAEP